MTITTVKPKTAKQLLARLTEVERIGIRSASPGRLEFLRLSSLASDGPVTAQALAEVKEILDAEFQSFECRDWWVTQTWKL